MIPAGNNSFRLQRVSSNGQSKIKQASQSDPSPEAAN
jgi:hypothetical protein